MPRMDKLSPYRTTIAAGEPGETVITYVSTPIVKFDRDKVTLDSGGYRTVTTKRKMNQAARQFSLPYSVYQRDFDWFVYNRHNGHTAPFEDGMIIRRD